MDTDIKTPNLLDGFEVVPSDGIPAINLDKQRRFYVNSSAQKLLGVKPYDRLSVLYNALERSLAIVKPQADVEIDNAAISQYNVDRRYYMSARKFTSIYGYSIGNAPYSFVYDRGSSDGNIFVFTLTEESGY